MIYSDVDRLGRTHWRDSVTGKYVKAPLPLFCWRFTYGLMFAEHHKYYAFVGQVWCVERDESKAAEVRSAVSSLVESRSYAFKIDSVEAEGWQSVPFDDGVNQGFGKVYTREEYRRKGQWQRV